MELVLQLVVFVLCFVVALGLVGKVEHDARHPAPVVAGVTPRSPPTLAPSLRAAMNQRPFPPAPRWRGESKGWR